MGLDSSKDMKILFKFPTRGRPKQFCAVLDKYYSMMSKQYEYEFIITLDADDKLMNTETMRQYLDSKPNLRYFFGNSKTKIEACNADLEDTEFDILVLLSDDMVPIVGSYDKVIVQQMEKHFPDMDGAVGFHDGLRPDHLITLSIMGRKLYKYFGYIYHPAYKSYWCDNEFTRVVENLKKVVFSTTVLIKHNWKGDRSDPTYCKNYKYEHLDGPTFKRREALGFPRHEI